MPRPAQGKLLCEQTVCNLPADLHKPHFGDPAPLELRCSRRISARRGATRGAQVAIALEVKLSALPFDPRPEGLHLPTAMWTAQSLHAALRTQFVKSALRTQ
jgi:hypothetical protein